MSGSETINDKSKCECAARLPDLNHFSSDRSSFIRGLVTARLDGWGPNKEGWLSSWARTLCAVRVSWVGSWDGMVGGVLRAVALPVWARGGGCWLKGQTNSSYLNFNFRLDRDHYLTSLSTISIPCADQQKVVNQQLSEVNGASY
eukprot:scaffold49512_cov57-Cyclotella_meneghiniana.AAC.2